MRRYLGIDIGGTFIKFVYKKGDDIEKGKVYIREIISKNRPDLIVDEIRKIVKKYRPDILGVAVAGLIDKKTGVLTASPNIKPLENFPFKDELENSLKIPVYIENDASLAAYGEYLYGAGKGSEILICLTLGTGLGGGAVINGKLLTGVSGSAMEIGHTTIEMDGLPCHCGRKGCLESYVSSYGLERIYYLYTDQKISSSQIITLANEGDLTAMRSMERFSEYLSVGLMNIVHIFNPDRIVLAGGITENYPAVVDMAVSNLKNIAFHLPFRDLTVKRAELKEFSGAYGALGYAENESR
ncbi:MAG TPA: ROK family protein [Persephonella sp.]|uniref:Xylose repressor n=1 Tax=Persephonella marina (strain DSM 14350 / EX-H1) TaxID=123214 RepID=C0QRM3_PERMH|nr:MULTISPECIES: ROK family protein [Persephonella]ACO03391.1 xylose repressor [Persephonella marina EX-H1]HCB69065.1 ROK family protein [Persephonella sp.]